ncbi:hypothetical protein G7Z17_g10413 [Cylindrodendrum hubeiense]|uniref:Uncharacterized protein n=1 Tax=Cylindrodendrum hubeiense TaxID=595255 RepID=A0A9P5L7A0_9HYPO|nr:hypothetical protein G7Z17_g10413 [Cylindrodendrum hubeiense]
MGGGKSASSLLMSRQLGAEPPDWAGHCTTNPAKPARIVAVRRSDRAGRAGGANVMHLRAAPETVRDHSGLTTARTAEREPKNPGVWEPRGGALALGA